MAKRFGRNQRRHLKDKVDTLETRLDAKGRHVRLLNEMNDSLKEQLVEWAGRILRNTTEGSAFRKELDEIGISESMMEAIKAGDPLRMRQASRETYFLTEVPEEYSICKEVINCYAVYVETSEAPLEDAFMFYAITPKGARVMGIDNRTFDRELQHRGFGKLGEHIKHGIMKGLKERGTSRQSDRYGFSPDFPGRYG